jgi:hypothetical protein
MVGLGPGFVADGNVDIAVETGWDALGGIVRTGPTRPLAGELRPISGVAHDRNVQAPVAGIVRTRRDAGEPVRAGEGVAHTGETPLSAPVVRILGAIVRDGVLVEAGAKVVEVAPRGAAEVAGIGERPGRIAAGVPAVARVWRRPRRGTDGERYPAGSLPPAHGWLGPATGYARDRPGTLARHRPLGGRSWRSLVSGHAPAARPCQPGRGLVESDCPQKQ